MARQDAARLARERGRGVHRVSARADSLARGLERRIGGDARFAASDRAVAESGFRIVVLLRLSPVVPFNLLKFPMRFKPLSFRAFLSSALRVKRFQA
ncbi:MAG TPA: hypothetical protein VF973_02035 [Myxococcales bacterium]